MPPAAVPGCLKPRGSPGSGHRSTCSRATIADLPLDVGDVKSCESAIRHQGAVEGDADEPRHDEVAADVRCVPESAWKDLMLRRRISLSSINTVPSWVAARGMSARRDSRRSGPPTECRCWGYAREASGGHPRPRLRSRSRSVPIAALPNTAELPKSARTIRVMRAVECHRPMCRTILQFAQDRPVGSQAPRPVRREARRHGIIERVSAGRRPGAGDDRRHGECIRRSTPTGIEAGTRTRCGSCRLLVTKAAQRLD